MLNAVLEFSRSIVAVNGFTWAVVIGLSVMSYWIVRSMSGSLLLASVYLPFLIVGALSANYIFVKFDILPVQDKDSNVVFACGAGLVGTLLALLMLTRLISTVLEARRNKDRSGANTLISAR